MDRYDFERALNAAHAANKNHESILESYTGIATSPSEAAQKSLFDYINRDKFRGVCPWKSVKFKAKAGVRQQPDGRLWVSSLDKNSFKVIYDYLMKNSPQANVLLNIGREDNAIGAGEIMMAYIVENMTIGGGSADTDLAIFDEKWEPIKGSSGVCELKESQMNKGMLANWRTGAKHQGINSSHVPELTRLYDAVKSSIPEIDPNTDEGKKLTEKGGWINEWGTVGGKRFKHIENLTREEINLLSSSDREFKIGPGKDGSVVVKYQEAVLGDINDPKTIDKIKLTLSSKSSVKTFSETQTEVIKKVGAIPTPFLFIESKGSKDLDEETATRKIINFHYYKRLPGNVDDIKIHSITQGKFKYKIKPNKV